MRRVVSALVLAVFVAGPGVRVPCLLLCTTPHHASPASSSCHEQPAAGTTIGEMRSCVTTTPAVLTAVTRANADSSVGFIVSAPHATVPGEYSTPNRVIHSPPGHRPLSPPLLRPLRI